MSVWNNIIAVIRREFGILRRRPIYLIGSVGVLIFCSVFFLTFFGKGLPDKLPIGIVDCDNSSMSRNLCQQLDATQLGSTIKYSSFAEARQDMQSGKICAVCVIPEGMYADVSANRRPTFSYYLNGLYYVGGSLAYKDILQMINLVNGAVQRKVLYAKGVSEYQAMNMLRPVNIDTHQIGNPYTNYGYYISNIMLPGILGMIVIIVLIYSLGTELKYGTSRHLMKTAGGSIMTALTGKLIVFTVLFSVLGLGLMDLLYHWMHFPIEGSIWNMFIAVLLFVMANEAIAILIIGCFPIPRLALSIGALYSVLGISLSGFSLPLEAMPAWFHGPAQLFPLRHYYQFYVQEVIFGTGFAGWYREAVYMLLFLFLPFLVLNRLKGAYVNQNYPKD